MSENIEGYDISRIIGIGSSSSVYAAKNKNSGQDVVIKVLNSSGDHGWLFRNGEFIPNEVARLQDLKHVPGVVQILDAFCTSEGKYCIILERCANNLVIDLYDYIELQGMLSEEVAKNIFKQVYNTLCSCWLDMDIAHGDVKEENIIINTDTGEVKLIDFGASYHANTTPTFLTGTSHYFPPEYYTRGYINADPATVWSLGLLLYKCLTGKDAFESERGCIYERVDMRELADVGQSCKDLIIRCLNKIPSARIYLQDIGEHAWMSE